ncbi:MAG: MFS transporter [Lachnospiraceae bacterium]|nr:MFS transporter [Lachnospiraceae bacterium]
MKHVNREEMKLITGIIIVSLLCQVNTMLSPALSAFQQSFPDAADTMIQALITIPSLTSIPFFLIGGARSRLVTTKRMLLVGVALVSVGGLLPVFLDNIFWILVCRMVMGAGLGFVSPFSQSLISDNFEGEEITVMFGIQAAAISAGNMIGCYVSGYLATISYHASFLCYLLAPIAFITTVILVPSISKHPAERGKSALKDYLEVPLNLWLRYIFMFGFSIVYFTYFNNTSLLMSARGIGDTAAAGMTTAFSCIIGIIAGLMMPKLHSWLKGMMIPAMTLCMALGMMAELKAESLVLINLSSFLIGFAFSVVMPFMVADITRSEPDMNHTVTSSLFVTANAIGASVSAVLLEWVSNLLGMEGPVGQVSIGVALGFVLTGGALAAELVSRRNKSRKEE